MIKVKITKYFFQTKKIINLLNELYPEKSYTELKKGLCLLKKNPDFHLLTASNDQEIIATACLHSGYLLYCAKYLQISSLYIKPNFRNLGIAQKFFEEAEKIAHKNSCNQMVLDSYITNNNSHKTYYRENFSINAYHFVKKL